MCGKSTDPADRTNVKPGCVCYMPVSAGTFCYEKEADVCIGFYQSYQFGDNPTKYTMCGLEGGKCVAVGEKTEAMPVTCAMPSPTPTPSPTPEPCFFPTSYVGADFCYQMPEGACDGYVQAYTFNANPTKYKMCGLEGGKCVAVGEQTETMPET